MWMLKWLLFFITHYFVLMCRLESIRLQSLPIWQHNASHYLPEIMLARCSRLMTRKIPLEHCQVSVKTSTGKYTIPMSVPHNAPINVLPNYPHRLYGAIMGTMGIWYGKQYFFLFQMLHSEVILLPIILWWENFSCQFSWRWRVSVVLSPRSFFKLYSYQLPTYLWPKIYKSTWRRAWGMRLR